LLVEGAGELEVDGIFSGEEVLVVVDISLAPEAGLVVEDVCLLVDGVVLGAPEDAVGVMRERGEESGQVWVVAVKGISIIIPVDGHCEGVG
jgi:hypothetical protein